MLVRTRLIAPSVHETCIRRVRSDRAPAVPDISSAGSPGCGQNVGSRAVRRWQCVGRPRLMQASRGARILFRCCSSRMDHEERPPLVEVGDLRAGGLRAVPTAALLARSHLPRPERERRADDHGEDHDERAQLPVLYEVLAAHTRTSDDCYLCLWEGIGDLHPAVSASPSIVATASGERGRERRPSSPPRCWTRQRSSCTIGSTYCPKGACRCRGLGCCRHVAGPPPGYLPAAFVWLADHAWCVAHDIDPHWAGIGTDADVVDQFVTEPRLDGVSADPSDEQSSFD